ncbi:MAG: glycosyltransferase family 2 protein [Muribaculaceae bacterium]|nr:glycosyltransferase family 2 protein [Muribaculaceae bacterium]
MISIIIPIYGVEDFIEECLASVVAQTCGEPLECILVDDCSPDGSMERAARFVDAYSGPVAFRVLRHDENRGLGEARNTGIEAARGEWLFFLDSDDTLPPGAMEYLMQRVAAHPDAQIVAGEIREYGDGCDCTATPRVSLNTRLAFRGRRACRKAIYTHRTMRCEMCGKLVSRDFLRASGCRFAPRVLCEDFDMTFRVSRHVESLAIEPRVVYNYRIRPGSIMQSPEKARRRMRDLMLIMMRCARLIDRPAASRQVLWLLDRAVDMASALRWQAGDAPFAASRDGRAFAAVVRGLRRALRPWDSPAAWLSLSLLRVELASGLRATSPLYMPLHRAAKMFYRMAAR